MTVATVGCVTAKREGELVRFRLRVLGYLGGTIETTLEVRR